MSVSRTVSEIFSVKEWRDLETGGRACSRSLEMAPFNRPYTTFYWSAIVYIPLSGTVFEKNSDGMCNRLDTIPACDGRTDRQTDRHLATA